MTHQPQSARFQALFEPALKAYEKKAGVSLTQHPLAIKLQNCDSVEAITGLLQHQARDFEDLQGSDKIMKSIKTTASILSKLSSAASLADAFGLVRQQELAACFISLTVFIQTLPPAKAIQACLAILLDVRPILQFIRGWPSDIQVMQAAKGIISNCEALIDLLESIEHFLNRLDIYTRIPATPAIDEIVVKILVELISTLGLVTEELKQRRSSESFLPMRFTFAQRRAVKFVKKFFKEKDIEAVLERLDRLTQDEARTTAAHTLAIVHGLVQNMRGFMDGEQSTRLVISCIEYPFSLDEKASIDGIREDLSAFCWQQRASSVIH